MMFFNTSPVFRNSRSVRTEKASNDATIGNSTTAKTTGKDVDRARRTTRGAASCLVAGATLE